MTRKEYNRAAEMLRNGYGDEEKKVITEFLEEFFGLDNPRFDHKKFRKAVNED